MLQTSLEVTGLLKGGWVHIHRGRAGGEVSLCSVGVRSVRLPLPLLTVCLCVRAHVRGIYECECECVCVCVCVRVCPFGLHAFLL